jgi:hypothetical protein
MKIVSKKASRKEEADLNKRISPIAWQNVNLLGRFEFHNQQSVINMAIIKGWIIGYHP